MRYYSIIFAYCFCFTIALFIDTFFTLISGFLYVVFTRTENLITSKINNYFTWRLLQLEAQKNPRLKKIIDKYEIDKYEM